MNSFPFSGGWVGWMIGGYPFYLVEGGAPHQFARHNSLHPEDRIGPTASSESYGPPRTSSYCASADCGSAGHVSPISNPNLLCPPCETSRVQLLTGKRTMSEQQKFDLFSKRYPHTRENFSIAALDPAQVLPVGRRRSVARVSGAASRLGDVRENGRSAAPRLPIRSVFGSGSVRAYR